jgi:glyoxylase-like metal-dependent hydrolase (beta-lactamase superfamily II)
MKPGIKPFFDKDSKTVTYVVYDPAGKDCAIIDPVMDFDQASGRTSTGSADKVIEYMAEYDLEPAWILETHAHADHLSAAQYLKQKAGGRTGIGRFITETQATFKKLFNLGEEFKADGTQFDCLFDDGDLLKLGTMNIRVMHTPGHTPACVTYIIGDCAFVGDTLFMPDFGSARVDFPGGNAAILFQSIQRIFGLPDDTRLFMCHDYKAPGRNEYAWETTVAEQRQNNVQIHDGVSEREFIEFRTRRDKELGMPKLILPAIQVNIRAGNLPPADENGVAYLKLPVNIL